MLFMSIKEFLLPYQSEIITSLISIVATALVIIFVIVLMLSITMALLSFSNGIQIHPILKFQKL